MTPGNFFKICLNLKKNNYEYLEEQEESADDEDGGYP